MALNQVRVCNFISCCSCSIPNEVYTSTIILYQGWIDTNTIKEATNKKNN